MRKQAFDKRIEALEALRQTADADARREHLRTTLSDRNNYLVSRAAALVAEFRVEELMPALVAAFERFFIDPVKSDPQCLAKSALAKALRSMGCRDARVYLRGIVHVQLEPAWGGRADSAGTLRGTCALALTDCPLDDIEILTYLADGLADPDKLVRIDSALAIAQLGRREGAVPLRLKLLLGDPESDVMGHCCTSLLSVAPDGAASFVGRFLQSDNAAVQLEAASALAQCRDPHAIDILKEFWQEPLTSFDMRRALLMSLGASPVRDAAVFLLDVVSQESAALAASALSALALSRFRDELRPNIAAVVAGRNDPDLER
jgi:HEAT repeat protein